MPKGLMQRKVLYTHETVVQFLKENGKTKQSKSCIWVYRTDIHEWPPIVLYKCQPERKVEKFLDGFHGYLHTDASDVTCCGYCPICAESLWRPYLATSSNPEGLLTPAQIGRDCCDQLIYRWKETGWTASLRKAETAPCGGKPILRVFVAGWESWNIVASGRKSGKGCTIRLQTAHSTIKI